MLKQYINFFMAALISLLLSACGGTSSETESSTQMQDTVPTNNNESESELSTDNTDEESAQPQEPVIPGPEEIEPNEPLAPEARMPQPTAEEVQPEPQPRLNLPPANTLALELKDPRIFSFSWRPMRGITHYSLFERKSDDGDFAILKDNISPLEIDFEIELPLLSRVTASYKLQACTEDGCTDSNTVSMSAVDADLNSAIGTLTSDKSDNFDRFGRAVSISGDGLTIAVGSPFDDVLPATPGFAGDDTGTVTIYKKNTETLKWQESAYLVSPAGNNSYFGRSLQLDDDGDILAIGANGVNSVYIYGEENDIWSQMARVQPPQPEPTDNFGYSVAINDQGNRIIVGAHGEDSSASGATDNDLENSGAAYIFARPSSTLPIWRQVGHLKASNADVGDQFGWSVDMNGNSGNVVIVGAPREDSNSFGQYSDIERDPNNNDVIDAGAAYIFRLVITGGVRWEQQSYLKAGSPRASNYFGHSVAIADFKSVVAIGARGSSKLAKDGNTQAGLVYTYTRENTATTLWRLGPLIAPNFHEDGDLFGYSLSFSKDGKTLAIGAPGENGYAAGIHYPSELSAEEGTGHENSGATYTFVFGSLSNFSLWFQSAYIRQPGISFGEDNFGYSVAIDNASDTLVVGQPGQQSARSGQKQGSVFIY